MSLRIVKILIFLSASALGAVSVWAETYVVKPNDTLSAIAHQMISGPVWGRRGSLSRILALNPTIKNPDLIYPTQSIEISSNAPLANRRISQDRMPASSDEVSKPEQKPNSSQSGSFGIFSIDSGFSSTRISSTENGNSSSATLLSKSNEQETFTYTQRWSESFESSIYFGLESLSINAPSVGGSIDDSSPTLHQFGVTSQWTFSSRWRGWLGLGMDQEPFLTGISSGAINLDLLYVPTLRAFSSYDLYQKGPFTMGITGGLGISGPSSTQVYRSNWNPDYQGAFYLKQSAFSWLALETGLKASYALENTSIVDQSQTNLGVYLKLSFPLGGSFK